MGVYEDLGVTPVINAAGTVTRYGGSLMNPEIIEVMREASQEFCVLDELHEQAGHRIAEMLGVEAAYVTASAACGLVLTAAACMAGTDPDKIAQLPDTDGMEHEVIIQKLHRIPYDQSIRLSGARLVEIGDGKTARWKNWIRPSTTKLPPSFIWRIRKIMKRWCHSMRR